MSWTTSRNNALICFMSFSANSRKTWYQQITNVNMTGNFFPATTCIRHTQNCSEASHRSISRLDTPESTYRHTDLLPTLNRKLRKNIFFKSANHKCCLYQIMQFFMVTCTLKDSKYSLKYQYCKQQQYSFIIERNSFKFFRRHLTKNPKSYCYLHPCNIGYHIHGHF